jgi:hypothetical protein
MKDVKRIPLPSLAQTLEALAHYAGQTKQDARSTLTGLIGILLQNPEGHRVTLDVFTIFIEAAQGTEAPMPTAEIIPANRIKALRKSKTAVAA